MPDHGNAQHATNGGSRDDRIKIVERLMKLFRWERYVYLSVTLISLVMLLTCTIVVIVKKGADAATVSGMFGSTGLITYTANRLLRMYDQAFKELFK